jgi:hypothetical protein
MIKNQIKSNSLKRLKKKENYLHKRKEKHKNLDQSQIHEKL